MKNIIPDIRVFFFLVVFLIPVQTQAQQWWNTNSLKLDSLQTGTLFHAQGTYGFSHMTGNVEMNVHQGASQLYLRNGRFMIVLNGQVNYQKVKVGEQPATKNESFMVNTKLIYDIQRKLQTETGMVWERDESRFMDRRIILYQGLIYNVLENEHLGKMFFGAIGYQFATSVELLPLLPVTKIDMPVAYLQQQLVLKFIDPFVFTQGLSYIRELNDGGMYRTNLSFSAQLPVASKVDVMVTHQTRYESEPIILALAPFFEKFSTTFTLGVQFNF